jgi:multiple sugar transport system substrate-binding protein
LQAVDPNTEQTLYQKDEGFKKYLNLLQRVYDIPGLLPDDKPKDYVKYSHIKNNFRTGKVAMLPFIDSHQELIKDEQTNGLDWDIAPFPVWSDLPKTDPVAPSGFLAISPLSKHQDDAFKVLAYFYTDEVQLIWSKSDWPAVIKNRDIKLAFGSGNPGMKDKNVAAYFVNKGAASPMKVSRYENSYDALSYMSNDLITGTKDINTLLRESDEGHSKKIAELKEANGSGAGK